MQGFEHEMLTSGDGSACVLPVEATQSMITSLTRNLSLYNILLRIIQSSGTNSFAGVVYCCDNGVQSCRPMFCPCFISAVAP